MPDWSPVARLSGTPQQSRAARAVGAESSDPPVLQVGGLPQATYTALFVALTLFLVWAVHGKLGFGQDAVPLAVAGSRWMRAAPAYPIAPDWWAESATYFRSSAETACATPFISTPLALPIVGLISIGGPRWVQAIGLALLTYAQHRLHLGWKSLLLVLPATWILFYGQTTPLLAAAAVAPVGVAGFLLAIGVAFKVTPALLFVPLARHWRSRKLDLIIASGTLCILQLVSVARGAPDSGWSTWMSSTAAFQTVLHDNPLDISPAPLAQAMVGLMLLAGLWRKQHDFDACWWLCWTGWPAMIPLCWWHYAWLSAMAVSNQRSWVGVPLLAGYALLPNLEPGLPSAIGSIWLVASFLAVLVTERQGPAKGETS